MPQRLKKNKVFLIFGAFIFLFGLLFWLFLKNIFFKESGGLSLVFNSFYFLFDLLLLVSFYAIGSIIFRDWKKILLLGILAVAPIFFIIPLETIIIFALLVFLLLAWLAYKIIARESRQRLKAEVHLITYQGISYLLSGIYIIIASFYYSSPTLDIASLDISIPKPIIEKSVTLAQSFLLESGSLPQGKVELPENLFDYVNQGVKKIIHNFKNYIALAFAIGIFWALRTFNFLIVPLSSAATALILKIFIFFKLISIKDEVVSVKRIVISSDS